jgi:hypothetical protein
LREQFRPKVLPYDGSPLQKMLRRFGKQGDAPLDNLTHSFGNMGEDGQRVLGLLFLPQMQPLLYEQRNPVGQRMQFLTENSRFAKTVQRRHTGNRF